MGELKDKANGGDPSITKGKVRTTFKKVEGCKWLDRLIAKKNMKDIGITQICKGNKSGRNNKTSAQSPKKIRRSDSKFARNWESYVY